MENCVWKVDILLDKLSNTPLGLVKETMKRKSDTPNDVARSCILEATEAERQQWSRQIIWRWLWSRRGKLGKTPHWSVIRRNLLIKKQF
jgi:hypothetical protein